MLTKNRIQSVLIHIIKQLFVYETLIDVISFDKTKQKQT